MRVRPLLVVVIAVVVIAGLTYAIEGPREMNDFEVFYRAAERFRGGEALYRAADGHFEFKYLPVAAALFVPLSLLPLPMAKIVWLGAICLSLALAFALAARLVRPPPWAPPVALFVLARCIEREFSNGQINALVLLIVVAAFLALERRRDGWGGALIGIAALLKPPWLLLLPYLILARRWRAAGRLAVVVLGGLALPALRYGLSGTLSLHAAMNARLAVSSVRLLTYPTNVSLPGAIAKLVGPSAAPLALVVLAVPCALFARRVLRDRARLDEDLALVAPLAILLSPQAWDYTVLTTLPTLLVASRRPRLLTAALAVVVALDPVLLFGHGASYASVMRWSPNTWFLLWAVLSSHRARVARDPPAAAASRARRASSRVPPAVGA